MPLRNHRARPLPTHVVRLKIWQAVGFIALVCCSLISLAIWGSWNSLQYQLREKEVALSNLAQTLSSQVQATIKQADTVLLWLAAEVEAEGMKTQHAPHLQGLLHTQVDQLKQLKALIIIGEDGLDQFRLLAIHPHQLDAKPLGGLAESGIEDMGGETGHGWGSRIMKGVSKKNSSRLLPGPSRSTTRKSLTSPIAIKGWCQVLRR